MEQWEDLVKDFFQMLVYMRDNYVRPADHIARVSLSPVQFHIVTALQHQQGPLSMTELAACLQISKQQLTPSIGKLVEAGLVNRYRDQQDRRVQRVELTEMGRQTLDEVSDKIKQAFCQRLKLLPPDDLAELSVIIKRAQEILQGNGGS
ncbi:MAG TPA: hypothetical protein DER60_10690 [Syntrophomonas sp.]|jgi:DNA-binding MarR family transcriptional regulator|nr:hypothetical protein [Syntrophomonas sp.]